jgi:hypothetical protein
MRINIKNINCLIDRYGYYAYLIRLNKSIKCNCHNPITKDANPACKKCLGTGYKITISKVFLASREVNEQESNKIQGFSATPKIMYLKGYVDVNKDDIIVDSESVFTVLEKQHHRGVGGYQAFTRCVCPDMKLNKALFIKLFKEVLNEYLSNGNKQK